MYVDIIIGVPVLFLYACMHVTILHTYIICTYVRTYPLNSMYNSDCNELNSYNDTCTMYVGIIGVLFLLFMHVHM